MTDDIKGKLAEAFRHRRSAGHYERRPDTEVREEAVKKRTQVEANYRAVARTTANARSPL